MVVGKPAGRLSFGVRDERRVVAPGSHGPPTRCRARRGHTSRACASGGRPERRIAAVEQQQAARFEGCKMLDQKLALVLLIGSDDGIKDEAVERVLGDPRQGGGITGNM